MGNNLKIDLYRITIYLEPRYKNNFFSVINQVNPAIAKLCDEIHEKTKVPTNNDMLNHWENEEEIRHQKLRWL